MEITRFTDYGIRTLMYISIHNEGIASVKEIAEYYGISRNHLVKIVHKLSLLGYIETTKGKGGGIKMAKGTENLRLGDLIKQLEPSMNIVECFDSKTNSCRITSTCQLKHYLFEATQNFICTMNKYTLADIVKNKNDLVIQSSSHPLK